MYWMLTYQELYTMLSVLHAWFHLVLTTAFRNWTARRNRTKIRGGVWSQTRPGFESCFFLLRSYWASPLLHWWGNRDSDKKRRSQVISQEQTVTGSKNNGIQNAQREKSGQIKMHHSTNGSTKLNSDTLNKCKSYVKWLCFSQASSLTTVLLTRLTPRSVTKNHQIQYGQIHNRARPNSSSQAGVDEGLKKMSHIYWFKYREPSQMRF